MKDSIKLAAIRKQWRVNSANPKDRVEATFKKEKALESIELKKNFVWSKFWNVPPFLIPNNEKDAEMINAILIKSWETQGSSCPELPQRYHPDDILLNLVCYQTNGFLNYYMKNIPGTQML